MSSNKEYRLLRFPCCGYGTDMDRNRKSETSNKTKLQTIRRRGISASSVTSQRVALLFFFTLSQHSSVLWGYADATNTAVWKTGPWGVCGSELCGPGGWQLRSVTCEDTLLHYRTRNENCKQFTKPTDRKSCFKICDHHQNEYNWHVGNWEVCKHSYQSQTEELSLVTNCGIHSSPDGEQIRQLSCVLNSNTSVVVENSVCERFFRPPSTQQNCRVPCPQNCVTSLFNSWSTCSSSCGNGTQTRVRHVIRMEKYGGTPCPDLSESRPCEDAPCHDFNLPNINQHKLKFEEWSSCRRARVDMKLLQRGGNSRRKKSRNLLRMVGVRTKRVHCLTKHGAVVGDSVAMSETCSVAQRCKVSQWSQWARCSSSCGSNGTQTRTRDLTGLPLGSNASSCPEFTQARMCVLPEDSFAPCKKYRWLAGGWSICELIHNASCGGGLQMRHVYCAFNDDFMIQQVSDSYTLRGEEGAVAWSRIQPVDDAFCDAQTKPSDWQECDVKCSFKCDLGQWSEWSECAFDSCQPHFAPANQTRVSKRSMRNRKGFKRRTRPVYNDYGRPEDCTHTLEVIPCDEARCFSWHVAHVSLCVPESGNCGHGTALQTLECHNMWRQVVETRACTSDRFATPLPSFVGCEVPCGKDCVVDDWSQWTPCGHSCKRGKGESERQTRKREILAHPGRTGIPCPLAEELHETRMCNQHKCSIYFWTTSKWSECEIKGNLEPPPVGLADNNVFGTNNRQSNDGRPLVFPHNEATDICGVGYQTRRVQCRKKNSRRVRQKMCISWDKPVSSRPCSVSCNQDCLLSEWSAWSSCESECSRKIRDKLLSSESFSPAGLLSVYQRRSRYIVRHRMGDGMPCEIELQQARLCDDASQCVAYKWHIRKWGPCMLAAGMTTVSGENGKCRGVKTRTIRCNLHTVSGNIPTDDIKCLQNAGPMPLASRPCATSCPRNLGFSEWMERLGCQASSIDATTIAVTADVTSSETTSSEDDSSYVPPQMIVRSVGPWSSCFIDDRDFQDTGDECPVDEHPTVPNDATSFTDVTASMEVCGRGRRKRPLGCFEESTGAMVDISFCSYRAFDEEECEVPCSVDCQMSGWAEWGLCGDLLRGQVIQGNSSHPRTLPCGESRRIRFKYFMELPSNGGRSCPVMDSDNQVYESQVCHTICNDNFFVSNGWDSCQPRRRRSHSNCGSGVQTRTVNCFRTERLSSFSNVAVLLEDKRLCDVTNMPLGADKCTLPCPGECVVSKWSSWQPCPGGIPGSCEGTVRIRTRRLLRQTDRDVTEAGCPDAQNLTQTEECQLNVNCFTYSAAWSEWSSCLAPRPAVCGEGRMRRRMNCVQSDGLPVHVSKCAAANVTIENPQSVKCRVDCPVDCEVTEWSAWSQCSGTCGVSRHRMRVRKISRQPSRTGRKCPQELVQTRPCCAKPCYKWSLLGWTTCSLTRGNCGSGSQERVVQCVQQDGTEVGAILCKKQQMKQDGDNGQLLDWFTAEQLRRPCHVPCPGECRMSDWSVWSRCHADCTLDVTPSPTNIPGIRTRSRIGYVVGSVPGVHCSPSEIEESPCPASESHCINYAWKVGPYIGHTREVSCVSEDNGMAVSTGCQEALKPAASVATPYCPQPCNRIRHSYCTTSGVCDCRSPYVAIYQSSSNQYLHECESKQHDQGTQVQETVDMRDTKAKDRENKDVTVVPPVVIVPANNSNDNDAWSVFNPVKPDGTLKVWAYGAIAGLVVLLVFTIALCYLIYSACCRRNSSAKNRQHRKRRRHRRSNSSGSNVGIGIMAGSVGGSSMYGGTGIPPYRINPNSSTSRYPTRTLSRTPSVRSGFTFPDRYDSDQD
ncbi:thrombospondin type-1 domain-containing protein 7A [Ciona intestinalis]